MNTTGNLRTGIVLILLALAGPLGAQDTRGSLVPDTPIMLWDGTTAEVRDLKVGALLWSWSAEGKPTQVRLTEIRRQNTASYIALKVGTLALQATGSQRILLADGKPVRLDAIKEGTKIWIAGPKGPEPAVVSSLRNLPATLVAYDLTVEGHGIFQAGGILLAD